MTTFAILAHDDPTMLARLCSALAPHPVVVHIDRRRPLEPFRTALVTHPHVRLIEHDRVLTNWGGWSIAEAALRLYREILPGAADNERVVLLSGHCYPLRPVADIVHDIECGPPLRLKGHPYLGLRDRTRTRLRHVYDLFPARQHGPRRIVYGLARKSAQLVAPLLPVRFRGEEELVIGSQWGVLTAKALREVVLPAAPVYRRRLRWTFAPEEVFFTTVVLRGPLAGQTPDGGPSPYLGERVAHYASIHHLDSSMTKTFTIDDLPELRESRMLFVRKVDSLRSADLLDALDQRAGRWTAGG